MQDASSSEVVLVVDDDDAMLRVVRRRIESLATVRTFNDGRSALDELETGERADIILLDLSMPGLSGMEVLQQVHERWPDVVVVMMTGDSTIANVVEAMRLGAYDYVVKPFLDDDVIGLAVTRALERRRLAQRNRSLELRLPVEQRFENIVGSAEPMRRVFDLVERAAPTDVTVLILGESGTGKELLARAVHNRSRRSNRPFIAVNCSALTDTLLESELFGHVRGAFTGASTSRIGLFEEASGGTLFLDEIGDVSPTMQMRLLRVLQEGEIKPVGAAEIRKVDVRVVAATNRDLMALVKSGGFREDLYYRLNVFPLQVPPLRERASDVPALAMHFVARHAVRHGKNVRCIAPQAMDALQAYSWPGNVRELENVIERALVLASGELLTVAELPAHMNSGTGAHRSVAVPRGTYTEAKQQATEAFERAYIEDILEREGGNLSAAARASGLDKTNLRRIMKRHGIDADRYRE